MYYLCNNFVKKFPDYIGLKELSLFYRYRLQNHHNPSGWEEGKTTAVVWNTFDAGYILNNILYVVPVLETTDRFMSLIQ